MSTLKQWEHIFARGVEFEALGVERLPFNKDVAGYNLSAAFHGHLCQVYGSYIGLIDSILEECENRRALELAHRR